ncbi:hypothetical protein SPRG_02826 [Saprolegnia parasitica CBS 223.65]|uniref:Myb/SANT-like domain-containing protein n=1 Tax=Saprolegnia parasitica (strain CBS 223.65) TaxID=695850 RepID=A0A067CPC6_SAPPC|nr:hypothetical protein SPRG_02826 [Saprolegnia parasitica CBS 223.65]KDO32348.1 hypothetical protein SPRG_02826 [Saprolegnia parasitica CBS 223.65]|eukprot:XP_012196803.1 hypothetical protein SPRG_02826 [Saprolegnia parasitica CBS 223.65]
MASAKDAKGRPKSVRSPSPPADKACAKGQKTKGKATTDAEPTTDAPTTDQAEPRDVVADVVATVETATDAVTTVETAIDETEIATDVTPTKATPQIFKKQIVKEAPVVWCDESISKLFELRYKSELAKKFNSRNNMQKNYAGECLAAELSVLMGRTFTVRQINNKFARMRTAWSTFKPSNPAETGSDPRPTNPPSHYDLMLEYWLEKPGMQRETLASTDDVPDTGSSDDDDDGQSVVVLDDDSDQESAPARKKHKTLSDKGKANDRTGTKKPMALGDAIAVGFSELKEGLVAMSEALARPQIQQAAPQGAPQGTASIDDVLRAIKTQSDLMMQMIAAIAAKQ